MPRTTAAKAGLSRSTMAVVAVVAAVAIAAVLSAFNNSNGLTTVSDAGAATRIDALARQLLGSRDGHRGGSSVAGEGHTTVDAIPGVLVLSFMNLVTAGSRLGFCRMVGSALQNQVPVEVLGLGEKFHGTIQKFEDVDERLSWDSVKDDTIVVFVDGVDVMWTEGVQRVVDVFRERFLPAGKRWVLGGECRCWPALLVDNATCHGAGSVAHPSSATPYVFPNTGVWVGEAGFVRHILQRLLWMSAADVGMHPQLMHSDQGRLMALLSHEGWRADADSTGHDVDPLSLSRIAIDTDAELVQNFGVPVVGVRSPETGTVTVKNHPDQDVLDECRPIGDVTVVGSSAADRAVRNVRTGSEPALLHFNGRSSAWRVLLPNLWFNIPPGPSTEADYHSNPAEHDAQARRRDSAASALEADDPDFPLHPRARSVTEVAKRVPLLRKQLQDMSFSHGGLLFRFGDVCQGIELTPEAAFALDGDGRAGAPLTQPRGSGGDAAAGAGAASGSGETTVGGDVEAQLDALVQEIDATRRSRAASGPRRHAAALVALARFLQHHTVDVDAVAKSARQRMGSTAACTSAAECYQLSQDLVVATINARRTTAAKRNAAHAPADSEGMDPSDPSNPLRGCDLQVVTQWLPEDEVQMVSLVGSPVGASVRDSGYLYEPVGEEYGFDSPGALDQALDLFFHAMSPAGVSASFWQHARYRERHVYMATLDDVVVAGNPPVIHTKCKAFVQSPGLLSPLVSEDGVLFTDAGVQKRVAVEATRESAIVDDTDNSSTGERFLLSAASVLQVDCHHYDVWLLQCLSRLALLMPALQSDIAMVVLVPAEPGAGSKPISFVEQSLQLFGVKGRRVVRYDGTQRFRVAKLLTVDWRQTDERPGLELLPPRAGLQAVRHAFTGEAPATTGGGGVDSSDDPESRGRAAQGGGGFDNAAGALSPQELRVDPQAEPAIKSVLVINATAADAAYAGGPTPFLANLDSLLVELRDALPEARASVRVMSPSEFTLAERVAAFVAADVVLAVNGPGMANIVFCRTGTAVVELTRPEAAYRQYQHAAAALDLRYFVATDVVSANAGGAAVWVRQPARIAALVLLALA